MPSVRIQGLVRLADHVRAEIGQGISAARKLELQEVVRRAVRRTEDILAHHNAQPPQLAAPSRKAYHFLKQMNWEQVLESTDAAPPPAPRLRWTGLTSYLDRLVNGLAHQPSQYEIDVIEQSIQQTSRRMEGTIAREGLEAEHLTDSTRSLRGWFAFMAVPENFKRYLDAVVLAKRVLDPQATPKWPRPLLIEFRPIRHIYKMRPYANATRIMLPTPMILFGDADFADLAQMMFPRDRYAKARIVQRMAEPDYADLVEEIETLGGVIDRTRGAFHDLAAVFDSVNAQFFSGAMSRPKLTWSRGFTRRKFGHYNHVQDWVMISSTLDQPHVPAFVVEYLMFHELLHKKHGIQWSNARAMAHTSAFYAEERTFPRLAKAEAWLHKLART